MKRCIILSIIILTHFTPNALLTKLVLNSGCNAREQLIINNIYKEETPLRLHMGCGENYFDNYINIDFPSTEHTIQNKVVADCLADITTLFFPPQTVTEIRLHHLFEHFDRATAIALLAAWSQWLIVDGLLIIETPDFDACTKLLENQTTSYRQKEIIMRHLYGSHEAEWAFHCDGWYRVKYENILNQLGFEIVKIYYVGNLLRNIIVVAQKKISLGYAQLCRIAQNILTTSMVDNSLGEQKLLKVWLESFRKKFDYMIQAQADAP